MIIDVAAIDWFDGTITLLVMGWIFLVALTW